MSHFVQFDDATKKVIFDSGTKKVQMAGRDCAYFAAGDTPIQYSVTISGVQSGGACTQQTGNGTYTLSQHSVNDCVWVERVGAGNDTISLVLQVCGATKVHIEVGVVHITPPGGTTYTFCNLDDDCDIDGDTIVNCQEADPGCGDPHPRCPTCWGDLPMSGGGGTAVFSRIG